MKKGKGWLSLILYLLIFAITAGILSYSFIMLGYYLIQAKLSSEYESIAYMARIYRDNAESEDGSIRAILEASDKEYIVRDEFGEVIEGNVDNTCGEKARVVSLSGVRDSVYVYADSKYPFISGSQYGFLTVDFPAVLGKLYGMDEGNVDPEIVTLTAEDEDAGIFENPIFFMTPGSDFLIKLPVWMGVPLSDKEVFIGKGYLAFNMGV